MIFVVTKISTAKCVRNLIKGLFWSQEDRCRDAHQSELNRKQLPKECQK